MVSADLSCDTFKRITADDRQRKAMGEDWTLWESLAVQIAQHNTAHEKRCQ